MHNSKKYIAWSGNYMKKDFQFPIWQKDKANIKEICSKASLLYINSWLFMTGIILPYLALRAK